jgi:hypothetical protein
MEIKINQIPNANGYDTYYDFHTYHMGLMDEIGHTIFQISNLTDRKNIEIRITHKELMGLADFIQQHIKADRY